MSKLYSELADIYHEMYQQIFNYKKEFKFYHNLLKINNCKSILEIGCGSGNLASYFLGKKYKYLGCDISKKMISIAKKVEPNADFITADMRNLKLKKKFDSIVVTGRSFTYLTTNEDVINTLNSFNSILKKDGILIFDNFNATEMISISKKTLPIQMVRTANLVIKRKSKKTLNLETGWTENWDAEYVVKERGKGKTKIIKDSSVLRSFTKDEISIFLKLCKFEELVNRKRGFSIITIAKKL